MKSRLLLSLWLLGAVLYAGSTVFLADAVLGGKGGVAKPANLALASDAQCPKTNASSAEAPAAKTVAALPVKPDPAEKPNEPAASPSSHPAQPSSDSAAREPAEQAPASADAQDRQASLGDGDSSPDTAQDQDGPAQDGGPSPQASQDGYGSNPDGGRDVGEGEWAQIVAGTADMRSEPSLQSQMIYALPAGWQVRVISRQRGWVQIQDSNSGAAGWVESTALAPSAGPGQHRGYEAYAPGQDPRYADQGYPQDDSWRWRRQERRGQFGDFVRRALGGW
jgi:hypothetical protein